MKVSNFLRREIHIVSLALHAVVDVITAAESVSDG